MQVPHVFSVDHPATPERINENFQFLCDQIAPPEAVQDPEPEA